MEVESEVLRVVGKMAFGVSVVIPAFDELENLRNLLPGLNRALAASGFVHFELLVILPRTAREDEFQEIERLGARPVRRYPSDSFGDAIRTGLCHVSPEIHWIVFMDGDGSHSPATVPRLLDADATADVVVASRYVPGGSTDNPLHLRLMSRTLNWAFGWCLGLPCRDVSTSFKRYRAEDIRSLDLTCDNFDVVEELLLRVKMLHGDSLVVLEIPDHFSQRRHGKTKRRLGPFVVSYVTTLLRLRRNLQGKSH